MTNEEAMDLVVRVENGVQEDDALVLEAYMLLHEQTTLDPEEWKKWFFRLHVVAGRRLVNYIKSRE